MSLQKSIYLNKNNDICVKIMLNNKKFIYSLFISQEQLIELNSLDTYNEQLKKINTIIKNYDNSFNNNDDKFKITFDKSYKTNVKNNHISLHFIKA